MVIGITGHSSGLGKYLFDYFTNLGHTCKGFSKSNGYNINDVDKIIAELHNVDLFINNAHYKTYQQEFLTKLHKTQIDIITIGSLTIDYYKKRKQEVTGWEYDYNEEKKNVGDTFLSLCINSAGNWLLLKPHFLESHPDKTKENSINFETISDSIELWFKHKHISTMSFVYKD